jgi:hypothetical protein
LGAGLLDDPGDTVDATEDESSNLVLRRKFPKGWVKIGVVGGIIRAKNNLTLEQACKPYGLHLEPEF